MTTGRSPIAPSGAVAPRSITDAVAERAARAEARGIVALAAGDLGGAHDAWEDAARAFADAGRAESARRMAQTLATSLLGAGEPFRALAWLPPDPGEGDPAPSLLRLAALTALGRYSEARPLAASLAASPLLPRADAARAARRLVEIEGVLGMPDTSPPLAVAATDPEDVRLEDALAAPGGPTPGEVARRAEEAGLLALACRARMAEARATWEAGDGRGRTSVTEASRLARASGDAALQHRVVRLAAELSLRQGADAASVVPTLRALVRRSQRARDTYGEARDRLILARALALHRPQAAPAEAMVALRLAEAGGYRRLAARAARLATLLGAADAARSPRLGDPPRTFEDRVLAAAAGVAATDSAGDLSAALAAWEAALEAAPSPARSPLDALCSRAFEGAGLVREGRGTAPALLFDDRDRTVWRDGVRIAAFGRGGLPYRLLLAVAAPGTRPPGREALFRAVWEQPYRPPSSDRALFTTAGRIRERLSPGAPRLDATPDGGYALSEVASLWRRSSAPPPRGAPDTGTRPSLSLALSASLPDLCALPGFAALAPAPRPRGGRPFGNLVPDPDVLLGRDDDLAVLEGAAGAATVLTLTGPPGIGRSRLARALALRLLPDRVARGGEAWWVDAEGAGEPGALASAIAGTLGVEPGAPEGDARLLAALGRALRARGPLLLVLDGVEEGAMAAEAIASLASAAPGILFAVPARAALGVPGERVHPVGPLDERAGRALYLARGGSAARDDGDAARLGGIPLALEIGAGLSSANGALGLPGDGDLVGARGGDEGVPGPLARVLDEAWGRLAPPERTALAALAARPARWIPRDLERALAGGAEGAGPEVAESVAALRRLGLVIREPDPTGSPALRVPEAVRAWALTRGIAPSADPPPAPRRTFSALTASAGGGEEDALLRVLDRAARAFAADDDAVGEAEAAVLLGAAHARAGRPEQAREAYARAAARAEGAGAAHLAARARLGESEAALSSGDAAGALASARAALDSVVVTGDAAHEAEAAVHLCAAALDLAPDLARTWIRLALAAPPHPGTESALARLRALEARRPGR